MGFLDFLVEVFKPETEEEKRKRIEEQNFRWEMREKKIPSYEFDRYAEKRRKEQLEKSKRDGTYRLHGKRYIYRGGSLMLDIDKETGHYCFPSQFSGCCPFCGRNDSSYMAGHCESCSREYEDNKEMIAKRVEQLYPGLNIEIDMYTCLLFLEVLSLCDNGLMTKEEAETAMRERIMDVREKQAAKERREREKREEKERLEKQKQHDKETWPKLMNQLNF